VLPDSSAGMGYKAARKIRYFELYQTGWEYAVPKREELFQRSLGLW